MATLIITLFASLVVFLFLASIIFESPKDRNLILRGVRVSMKKFSAGVLAYYMGIVSLIIWAHYLLGRVHTTIARGPFSISSAILQLCTSVLLIVAGHSTLRGWKKNAPIFYLTIGITLVVVMVSLMTYNLGPQPEGLYGVLGVIQIAGSVFAAAFYTADLVFSSSSIKKTPSEKYRTHVE